MNLNDISASNWDEWREHPVTEALKAAIKAMLDRQQAAAEQAYWAGKAWPESERLALVRLAAWHEDFFETTLEEVKQVMNDERQRNTPPKI